MSPPTTTAALAARYGNTPSAARRRRRLVVGAVALCAALAWLVWAGLGMARTDVRFEQVGFRLVGNQGVEVTYNVGKDPARTAVCTLQALDRTKATVGLAQVTIGPRPEKVSRNTSTVRTSALAVTGIVRDCSLLR